MSGVNLNPTVTELARCKVCKDIFRPDFSLIVNAQGGIDPVKLANAVQDCPRCGAKLDFERDILPAAIEYVWVTKAVSAGNSVLALDLAAVIHLGLLIYLTFAPFPSIYAFVSLGPLAIVIRWFSRYGKLASEDPEYLETRKRLRLSLYMWVALNVLTTGVFIYLLKR